MYRMRRVWRIFVLTAWVGATVGGLWGMPAPVEAGGVTVVTIEEGTIRFEPEEITIRPGDRVRWVNKDNQTHFLAGSVSTERLQTLTRQSDLFVFKALDPGDTYEKKLDLPPGTYYYYCGIHTKMWGIIHVVEK